MLESPPKTTTLQNYVAGEWIAAEAAETLEDRDPASGKVLAEVPLSNEADVDAAVAAAREAFPEWRRTPVTRRAATLFAFRDALLEHVPELTELVTRDMGKTSDDARGEVRRGIESVESAAATPHLMKGENLEGVARGLDVELVRQPVGVIAAITPFNFPAMIPLWFLPYAIATGNTIVMKPSERDPLPTVRIVEILAELNVLPPGVVNLVHGGREAVGTLLGHEDVEAISFVGQASTARMVATRAAETGKRVQALGGAKNSLLMMPDADLDVALPAIMGSSFGAAGQRCLAGSVCVLVGDEAEQQRMQEAIVDAAAALRTGPGDEPETDVCPMISPEARDRAATMVDRAERDGSRVLLDGRDAAGPAGTVLGPTIVVAHDPEHEIAREEIFGPVLTLVGAADMEAALAFINDSRYGNAGTIFTTSGAAAREYRFGVEAGMLGINLGVPAPVAWFPFAGWKDSCDGDLHANGTDAIDFYTRKKVVTSRW